MTWTLPQQVYLLGYDVKKGEIGPQQFRGLVVRAAAFAELALAGAIEPVEGKALATGEAQPDDPFLARVLETLPGKPRHWLTLLQQDYRDAEPFVRRQLADAAQVTDEPGRLGSHKVTVRAPAAVEELRDSVRTLAPAPEQAAPRETVLAALAVDGELHTVFSLRERVKHRAAFKALGKEFDTVVPGLRTGLVSAIASMRAYGGGW